MKLLTLIRLYAGLTSTMRLQFMILATLSGISNAAVLAIINEAAENVKSKQANIYFLVLFLIAIALYVYTQKHLMVDICRRFEGMVHQVRVRLVERARHAELLEIERIGRSEIYACVSRETHTIAQAAPTIVIA